MKTLFLGTQHGKFVELENEARYSVLETTANTNNLSLSDNLFDIWGTQQRANNGSC